ncbi:hypothetical protein [Plantibacter sp. ME-Dv--P-095]|uniref:hypothetical protein n=1 Tax=Plantibacter sp. ME-Dv--P-095 TaxID=3040299 RepID=UPI002550BB66|nr:hypothetical protein [Plantibacter sp. ME-Dv--P-095]
MTRDLEDFLASDVALEATAAAEHDRWVHWQSYLHGQCELLEDGSLRIPARLVQRWKRQIETTYQDLDASEKESDREQAQAYLETLRASIDGWLHRSGGNSSPS